MSALNPKQNPVHYPIDPQQRRFHLWLCRPAVYLLFVLPFLLLCAAWVTYAIYGLAAVPTYAGSAGSSSQPTHLGFPSWLRFAHYLNFLFMFLLVRSGLSILMDHPHLYWNDHCQIGSEWIRFTAIATPPHADWTAKEDAVYISPLLALPGYRHSVGLARHWHFIVALFWFLNGLLYVGLLCSSDTWSRLVPQSWAIIPQAWHDVVAYATFHLPAELQTLGHYNAAQKLSYFIVVFIMAPLSFLTGLAMSPSLISRFPAYARCFGGRQAARSIHFLLLLGYCTFVAIHVTMVVVTDFTANMNLIVRGSNDGSSNGISYGLLGIAIVLLLAYLSQRISWRYPRLLQRAAQYIHIGFMHRFFFKHLRERATYKKADISPYFWPNGKMPESAEWQQLADNNFTDFRLRVYGLVENPIDLSLAEIQALGEQEQITMHHCIQGWTGIAQWNGLPLATLIALVRPSAAAQVIVFHSFGEGLYGGDYYDTQTIENALHPQCILATAMNDQPLSTLHGAPLRLRVENQLGYKMVKWIKSIEFVASEKDVGKGYGGRNEDDEYFDLIPEL